MRMNIMEFLQQDISPTRDDLLLDEYKSIKTSVANRYIWITDKFIRDWEYSPELREAAHYLSMEYYLVQKWLIQPTFM